MLHFMYGERNNTLRGNEGNGGKAFEGFALENIRGDNYMCNIVMLHMCYTCYTFD